VIQVQRLVVPLPDYAQARKASDLVHASNTATAFPNRVRSIERVILSLGAFEKVKFDKARHLVEMTIARQPTPARTRLRTPLATRKRFIAINMLVSLRWAGFTIVRIVSGRPQRLERAEVERPPSRENVGLSSYIVS